MGRPTKEGLDYFSVDCNFDREMQLMEAVHGAEGFRVIIKLWQIIYGGKGYFCPWGEQEILLFSSQNNIPENNLNEIVSSAVKFGFFDKKLKEKGVLTSHGIQKRFLAAASKRTSIFVYDDLFLVSAEESTLVMGFQSHKVQLRGSYFSGNYTSSVLIPESIPKEKEIKKRKEEGDGVFSPETQKQDSDSVPPDTSDFPDDDDHEPNTFDFPDDNQPVQTPIKKPKPITGPSYHKSPIDDNFRKCVELWNELHLPACKVKLSINMTKDQTRAMSIFDDYDLAHILDQIKAYSKTAAKTEYAYRSIYTFLEKGIERDYKADNIPEEDPDQPKTYQGPKECPDCKIPVVRVPGSTIYGCPKCHRTWRFNGTEEA